MNNSIKLLFAGDFGTRAPEKIIVAEDVKTLLNSTDLNILNFEGPLSSEEKCTANKTILKQSEKSAEWCSKYGFNVVTVANNHAFEYGQAGLKRTMQSLDDSNIIHVGAGTWENAYSIKTIEIKGKKIGFFAATSCDLASLKDKLYDYDKIGCAWINHPDTRRTIINCKKSCDYLFVLAHGGVEYMDIPLPEWREIYKELIDLGADGIIASHPHVPQGVEEYKGKPIFYSLGNFFFEGSGELNARKPPHWNTGLIAIIEITDTNIKYCTLTTVRDCYSLSIDNSEETKSHITYINKVLNDKELYCKKLEESVIKFHHKYKSWLLCGLNAKEIKFSIRNIVGYIKGLFRKPNERVAMHQLREESTRWTIERAFKIRTKTQL